MRGLIADFFTKGDLVLLGLCVAASTFGLVLLQTATNYMPDPEDQDRLLQVQFIATLVGIAFYMLISILDFRSLVEKCWKFIFVFNIGFLLLLTTSLGIGEETGNRNWLYIPGFPVTIQPNEIIKVTFILLLAHFISKIQEDERSISSVPSLVQLGSYVLMTIGMIAYICGDWGMCVIYACITIVMMWSAGLNAAWFGLVFGAVGFVVHVVWKYFLPYSSHWDTNYLVRRIRVLFDRDFESLGIGWHQTRSMLALGSGKFFGQGYGQGVQTQSPSENSLPARHTDFIFSVCGEELGMLGCGLLLVILLSIIFRCVWIAHHVDSFFAAYVAMGNAGMLLAQVFFNVGMCLFITPVMGLTLPFISYGGSSVVTMYMAMGIVSSLRARTLPSWIRDRGQLT